VHAANGQRALSFQQKERTRSDSEDGNGGVFTGGWAGVEGRGEVPDRRRYIYSDRGRNGIGRNHRDLRNACLRAGKFGMLMGTAGCILAGRLLVMAAAGRGFRGAAGVGRTIGEAVGIRK
jgi:hypothetical protein